MASYDSLTLSVLDLVPVRTDQTTSDALAATRSLARTADELGYRRYWLAEHHNMPAVAATNPPVLIAMVAGATERIRVGSGGVMLPNHAPLVVAEQFALLEAAHPGRIDLGIGRAPGTDPVTSWALRHGAGGVTDEAVSHFPEYVDNVLAMMEPSGVGPAGQRQDAHPHCDPEGLVGADHLAAGILRLLGSSGCGEGPALRVRPPLLRSGHGRGARPLPLAVPAITRARRAAHVPDGQRRRGAHQRGGGAARPAAAAADGEPAHGRSPSTRSRWSRRPRRSTFPTPTSRCSRRCVVAG